MKKGSHHSSDSLLQIHYAMKLVWKRRGFRERRIRTPQSKMRQTLLMVSRGANGPDKRRSQPSQRRARRDSRAGDASRTWVRGAWAI